MIARISRFLADPASATFEELALAVFAFQYEHAEPFRRLCDSRGVAPAAVNDWRQVPPVPTAAFRRLRLAAAPEQVIFRSSGTGGGPDQRSVHHHPYPDLYRQVIDASFPQFCLPAGALLPMLSLVPPLSQVADSSLSFMIDHVMGRFAQPAASAVAVGRRGIEAVPARSWTAARQRDHQPSLILATSLALDQWLAALERLDLRFRMPAGSALFETGGFKGQSVEVSPERQLERLEERLGLPPASVVREYGMTELTSQCYTRTLLGGEPDLYVPPHWMRVRILDPLTLEEAAAGAPGLVALFDLANLGSAAHLLTEDLGVAAVAADGAVGFRLLGRAAGAELRGCSLVAEELMAGTGAASSAS